MLLYADDSVLIVDKPSGLLTQPGRGEHLRDSVIVRMQGLFPGAGPVPGAGVVHRLDRDTSGVMVLARTAEAHRELSRQFHDRLVEKRYIAVVAGMMEHDPGRITAPIRKDMDHPPRHMVDFELGREAITDYRTPGTPGNPGNASHDAPGCTRLELTPLTGRSHQLRIHLAHIGHPILGDPLYGDASSAARLMLHAISLTFTHPASGDRVTFTAPCPF